jgi:Domain of unknown function (DUF4476)
MKTIFTFFASLILSIAVFAAPSGIAARPKSILTIKSIDRGDIRVIIDGRRFEPNDNYLRIQGIESGSHDIKIYRERNGGLFTIFGKRYEVVFSKCITVNPRTNVMISVDRFGRTTVNESRVNGWGFGRDDKGFDDHNNRDWDNNHDFNYDRGGKQGDYDKDRDGKWDNHDGRYDDKDDRGYSDNGYNKGMNDREFSQVLQAISKEWLESNKLKSATQIVTANSLTSAQVKQLVLMFSFESNKLELAKQAYRNTVDKNNYFMINDVFSFSSSKDDLARFIRSSR